MSEHLKRWEQEQEEWFKKKRQEIEAQVLRFLWKYGIQLALLLCAPGALVGYSLISNSKDLREKSERTVALNDSIRREFSHTRDSLHAELEIAHSLAEQQRSLLSVYQQGYLTTLQDAANLKGTVVGQMAQNENARQHTEGALRTLDSLRTRVARASDTLTQRVVQHDTTIDHLEGEVRRLGGRVATLTDHTAAAQVHRVPSGRRTELNGTPLAVWFTIDRGRIHNFFVFSKGERLLARPELLQQESVTVSASGINYRLTVKEVRSGFGRGAADIQVEAVPEV